MKQSLPEASSPEVLARDILAGLSQKPAITKEDVSALRASDARIGLLSFDSAAAIVAIERSPVDKCREWGELLNEMLLDFLVWGERPSGVVTDQQAAWLLVQVGETPTPACMALLISVLDEAQTVPGWFSEAVRIRAMNALAVISGPRHQAA